MVKNPTKKSVAVKEPKNNTQKTNRRITLDLPIELHMKLKIASAKTGETMGDIMRNLLEKHLKQERS